MLQQTKITEVHIYTDYTNDKFLESLRPHPLYSGSTFSNNYVADIFSVVPIHLRMFLVKTLQSFRNNVNVIVQTYWGM